MLPPLSLAPFSLRIMYYKFTESTSRLRRAGPHNIRDVLLRHQGNLRLIDHRRESGPVFQIPNRQLNRHARFQFRDLINGGGQIPSL